MAGAASLAAPGLALLEGLTRDGAVAMAADSAGDIAASAQGAATVTLGGASVRPPSIPLAVRSPYLSAWLPATSLTSATPQFWNGAARGFVGLVRIDGQPYAWAGQPLLSNGAAVPALTAISTEVTATRSIFTAGAGGVELTVEWLSPVEPGNLELQSAPLTLLTVSASFTDGNSHEVQVYADITGEWASSDEQALISWQTASDATGRYWTVDLQSPDPLTETNQMANWGTVVWAAARSSSLTYQSGYSADVRSEFAATGNLLDRSDANLRAINDEQPAFAFAVNFGTAGGSTSFALGHVRTPLVSYGQSATPLLPLWTQYWAGWQPMTAAFLAGAASARARAEALDAEIQAAATATTGGGSGYAALCALALRQCYGGTELAIGPDGSPWLLGKEISSDGDTNTVDIFDQAFLAWLWLDPGLIPLVMAPILDWCASPAWQNASAWAGIAQPYYCVHDLGVYPVPAGLVPGEGEQMPIEESAGMLIMAAAYARAVGASAAAPFLRQWQTLWSQWANYLLTQVPSQASPLTMPATQLTTDDWVGPYREPTGSVNLAIKAIIGLAAAGQIATILGDTTHATTWSGAATGSVTDWVNNSTDTSGDYLNLEQGAGGTWSCLYNAYYQTVIGASLVPGHIADIQAGKYLSELNTYGIELQTGAGNLNKVAWLFFLPAWFSSYSTGTYSNNNYSIIADLMASNVAYVNNTPSLVPYGDRYNTTTAVEVTGIQAHPTLGAVFALLAASGPAYVAGAERGASVTDAGAPSAPSSSAAAKPATRVSKPARHRRRKKRKRRMKHGAKQRRKKTRRRKRAR
jgi:hypothetical protein